jgi:hypothetical protein
MTSVVAMGLMTAWVYGMTVLMLTLKVTDSGLWS